MSDALRVFAFSPSWGLPTTGPFALKLLAWLRLAGIPHSVVAEDDARKGPKGKSPWIELDGDRMADSQLIIQHLSARFEVDPDADLGPEQRAQALAWRHLFEEHFHQVYEYELIVDPDGQLHFKQLFMGLPPVVRDLVFTMMTRHFAKQLKARGVARHPPDQIARMGCADLDAYAIWLGDRPFAFGDQPTSLDAVAFGFIAPLVKSQLPTPTWRHAREHEVLRPYIERLHDRLFVDNGDAPAASVAV